MNIKEHAILKTMHVLLAEDDEQTANFLAEIFRDYFENVSIVRDGKEALEFIKQNHIDLLITDIAMPTFSGIRLIESIRLAEQKISGKQLPIIVISGRQDTHELLEIARLKLIDYVLKPISLARINEVVQRLHIEIKTQNTYMYRIDDEMVYDPFSKSLKEANQTILLTPMEIILMESLLENKGKLIARSILMEKIYNRQVPDVTFRNLLARFRKKIGCNRIINIKDIGIKLK